MQIFNLGGIVNNKLMEFKTRLKLLQRENNELLDGAKLADECQPYISIQPAGVNYRKYLPEKVKLKVEALFKKIFE
jgi:hypothetical protein